jgi:hypothetical protein
MVRPCNGIAGNPAAISGVELLRQQEFFFAEMSLSGLCSSGKELPFTVSPLADSQGTSRP